MRIKNRIVCILISSIFAFSTLFFVGCKYESEPSDSQSNSGQSKPSSSSNQSQLMPAEDFINNNDWNFLLKNCWSIRLDVVSNLAPGSNVEKYTMICKFTLTNEFFNNKSIYRSGNDINKIMKECISDIDKCRKEYRDSLARP